jgi:hypothetical protein
MIGTAWVLREAVCECQANCAANVREIVPDRSRREALGSGLFGNISLAVRLTSADVGPAAA